MYILPRWTAKENKNKKHPEIYYFCSKNMVMNWIYWWWQICAVIPVILLVVWLRKIGYFNHAYSLYRKAYHKYQRVRGGNMTYERFVNEFCSEHQYVEGNNTAELNEKARDVGNLVELLTYFPPNRSSYNLKRWSNGTKELSNKSLYENCLLPEKVILPDGFELHCPDKWKSS
jgi:hypothetical protein